MLNIPESVKTLFKQDGGHKNFRVQFPNGEREDITNANVVQESVRFTESLCSQDIFKFGLAEASVLEFETVGVENIYGATIKAGIEIDLSSLTADEIAAIRAGTWDGELVEVGAGEDYPNLLDGLEWVSGYYNENGRITSSANAVREDDYLPVSPGATYDYTSTKPASNTNAVRVHEYDDNQTWLRQIAVSSQATVTWTASDDAAYIRVSVPRVATDLSIKRQGTMPDYYFRVPYGDFAVESCPRDHQAMTHRKVTAYTVGRLNRSPLEDSKLTWTSTKKLNYRPNVQRLVMAELGWNSPQILNTMTKTQYDDFRTWDSDEKNLFWQPFDPDASRVSAQITVKRRYLPFGDGVTGNALYCLEMQDFDISIVLDAIADYIDNGEHSAALTPYREEILGFIETSIYAFIGEYQFRSSLPIFYPHWAQPTSMYIPYSFTVSVGGIDPISAASWSTEETGAPFTTDPVLYTYDFDDGNIILAYEPTGKVTSSIGKIWTYLDAYDINDIVGGVLETEAAFARVERNGGFSFCRLDDSSPVPVPPDEYENMWFDEYDVEPIGTVRYAYTNKAGEEQVGESEVGDGASVYDMTDNAVLKQMLYASDDLLQNLIGTSFVPYIEPVNFAPVDLNMKGLPYIQAGDCLEVTAQDGTVCKTFVLRQEISGIQALSAQIDSQSGLIIESEDE